MLRAKRCVYLYAFKAASQGLFYVGRQQVALGYRGAGNPIHLQVRNRLDMDGYCISSPQLLYCTLLLSSNWKPQCALFRFELNHVRMSGSGDVSGDSRFGYPLLSNSCRVQLKRRRKRHSFTANNLAIKRTETQLRPEICWPRTAVP